MEEKERNRQITNHTNTLNRLGQRVNESSLTSLQKNHKLSDESNLRLSQLDDCIRQLNDIDTEFQAFHAVLMTDNLRTALASKIEPFKVQFDRIATELREEFGIINERVTRERAQLRDSEEKSRAALEQIHAKIDEVISKVEDMFSQFIDIINNEQSIIGIDQKTVIAHKYTINAQSKLNAVAKDDTFRPIKARIQTEYSHATATIKNIDDQITQASNYYKATLFWKLYVSSPKLNLIRPKDWLTYLYWLHFAPSSYLAYLIEHGRHSLTPFRSWFATTLFSLLIFIPALGLILHRIPTNAALLPMANIVFVLVPVAWICSAIGMADWSDDLSFDREVRDILLEIKGRGVTHRYSYEHWYPRYGHDGSANEYLNEWMVSQPSNRRWLVAIGFFFGVISIFLLAPIITDMWQWVALLFAGSVVYCYRIGASVDIVFLFSLYVSSSLAVGIDRWNAGLTNDTSYGGNFQSWLGFVGGGWIVGGAIGTLLGLLSVSAVNFLLIPQHMTLRKPIIRWIALPCLIISFGAIICVFLLKA